MSNRMASKTLRNLLLSLAAVMIPVVIIAAFFTRDPEEKAKPVEWQGPLAAARHDAAFPVVAPDLPDGWTATKASWVRRGNPQGDGSPATGDTWTMAWISPERLYFGLAQRDAAGPELISQAGRQGRADGSSTVRGATWARYLSPDGRTRVLARDADGCTTVVSGDVPYASLEQFAATLVAG